LPRAARQTLEEMVKPLVEMEKKLYG